MYHSQQKVCKFFMDGHCKNGTKCTYKHPDPSYQSHTHKGSSSVYTVNKYAPLNQSPIPTDYSQPGSFSSKIRQNKSGPVTDNSSNQKHPFQSKASNSLTSTHPFASNSNVQKSPATGLDHASTYSKVSDLTKEEIEAFKAQSFVMGKIPTKPPPKELCQ